MNRGDEYPPRDCIRADKRDRYTQSDRRKKPRYHRTIPRRVCHAHDLRGTHRDSTLFWDRETHHEYHDRDHSRHHIESDPPCSLLLSRDRTLLWDLPCL